MDTPHEHGQTFQCRVTSEAVTKPKTSPRIVYEQDEEVDTSQLDTFQPQHKILIQRVFQQTTKGVVEQKLDYIVATSDEEITKHVFGGLFKNRYYPYRPENYCKKHEPNLFEHKDEALLKLGDKFDSLETFRLYIDSYAKQWKYYLKCADSHRGISTFVYKCVFGGTPREQYYNPKGLRKRTPKLPNLRTCPCRVIIKPVPESADTLTVVYVCNHHDHPLTDENFEKLQHGRRIHPSVKEELMDLLSLDVDREVVKKYCESLTGFVMESTYFSNMLMWMKKNNIERQFTLEKLKEMSKKIERIKEELGLADDHNFEDETVENDSIVPDKASQIQEAINMLRSVAAGKKPPPKPRPPRPNTGKKRSKINKEEYDEDTSTASPVVNRSRLEARLQELTYDHETLQSIKHLQDSVRGEPDDWPAQQDVEPWNRSTRKKRIKSAQKHTQNEEPELEPQTVVIENTQNIDGYVENQEIICENEVTVMEMPAENYNEIVLYENPDETNGTEVLDTDNEVSYCIKYEDIDVNEQTEDQYVLLENLENVPEVHIQATQLATVSIVSPKEEAKEHTELKQDEKTEETIEDTTTPNVNETDSTFTDSDKIQFIKVDSGNIKVIGEADATVGLNEDILYEVVNTNDKKLYPSRELVRKVILNKPSSKISKKSTEEFDEACYSSKHNDRLNKSKSRKPKLDDLDSLVKTFVKEEELETLNDDEYYMVVVNNDELDVTAQNDDYDRYNIKSLNADRYSCTSEDLVLDEIDNSGVLRVNKKIQCNFLSATVIDTEIKTINRLKRMRKSLQKDVKRLVATKDGLVKDIMKAKRVRRPRPIACYY